MGFWREVEALNRIRVPSGLAAIERILAMLLSKLISDESLLRLRRRGVIEAFTLAFGESTGYSAPYDLQVEFAGDGGWVKSDTHETDPVRQTI